MLDQTLCLSPACPARRECAIHWSNHLGRHNPYQRFATYDGSQGKECGHFEPTQEHRAAPSQPGNTETKN